MWAVLQRGISLNGAMVIAYLHEPTCRKPAVRRGSGIAPATWVRVSLFGDVVRPGPEASQGHRDVL
jgi:hypothetical protein